MLVLMLLQTFLLLLEAKTWVLLVSGTYGYENYRHQSNVYRAYQLYLNKGVPPQNIVVMAYDDIAFHPENPFPGRVYNKPDFAGPGDDIYRSLNIDYKGEQVNVRNFMNVLAGNKNQLTGTSRKKVIASTSEDTVIIYFASHGGVGLVQFPDDYLYSYGLMNALKGMNSRYERVVIYLESCEAGSMVVNLPADSRIYAVTASDTETDSWAAFCPAGDIVNRQHINSCLGDKFTHSWLENLNSTAIQSQTLDEEFVMLKLFTPNNTISRYGDISIASNKVSSLYPGSLITVKNSTSEPTATDFGIETHSYLNYLNYLTNLYNQYFETNRSQPLLVQLGQNILQMQTYDAMYTQVANNLSLSTVTLNPARINFGCYVPLIQYVECNCGRFTSYGLRYVRVLAKVCDKYGRGIPVMRPFVVKHCTETAFIVGPKGDLRGKKPVTDNPNGSFSGFQNN